MDKNVTTVANGQMKSAYSYENMQELYEQSAPEAEPVEEAGEEVGEEVVEPTTEGESHEEEGIEEGREEALQVTEEGAKPKKLRTYSVKVGDQTVSLTEDIELDHRVDGKPVKVSIGQLLNRYAGEESLDARHQKLKAQEKEFVASRQQLESQAQTAKKLIETVSESWGKKDLATFFKAITESAGIDQLEFEQNLLDTLAPVVAKWSELSDDQKKALVNQKKINHYQLREEQEKKKAEERAKEQQFASSLQSFCEENGVEVPEFIASFEELRELKEGGHLKVDNFTPQDVLGYHRLKSVRKRVEAVIDRVNPDLHNDVEAIGSILSVLKDHQDFSDEDLEDIVQGAYGSDRTTEKLNKKLNKTPASVSPKVTSVKSQASKKTSNRGPDAPWTFDDIL